MSRYINTQSIIMLLTMSACTALYASEYVADSPTYQLKRICPPGFETLKGRCELRNFYQMYSSLQGQGVGGLQTSLPDHRGGFSPQEMDLGRYLFFDPLLSKNKDMSCASCHQPDKGFSDGLAQSIGAEGKALTRSAPTLWNVGFLNTLFWDGRATSLEEQALGPLFDDKEMANTPKQLLSDLRGNKNYRQLFKQAFPYRKQIELNDVYRALSAFQSSLISLNSRYDQYAHGYHAALTQQEIEGLNIFRSFVARCAECHTPPLFTNQQIAVIGSPEQDGLTFDAGAQIPLNDPLFRGGFKVPSLRNITKTAPYMHSGRFKTLRETAAFYTGGRGHAIPKGETLYLHWHIWEPNLRDEEIDRIVDFLETLTDEKFKPQVPKTLPSGLSLIH